MVGKRVATVAAHDSSEEDRTNANYVCDGVLDGVEISAAFEHADEVRLMKGNYNFKPEATKMTNLWMEERCLGPIDDMGKPTGLEQCPERGERWETEGGYWFTYACPKHSVALAYSLYRWHHCRRVAPQLKM